MIDIYNITNLLVRFGIKLPETFWKEEAVRYMTELDSRIVEVPLIFNSIPMSRKRILDVGCRYSLLSIQLASVGHEVYGIDIDNYKRKHPNFHFCKGDILKSGYKSNYFDIVVSLSTIEHIGLGRYNDKKDILGDIKAIKEIYRITKPGGQIILTLPFGKPIDTDWFRVYDMERLQKLINGFKINKKYVFQDKCGSWLPSKVCDMEKNNSSIKPMAVIFVMATKI